MNSSRETLKGGFLHVRNAAGTPQKEVIFASDCYWLWNMDPLRQPQAQKIICETRPTSQINAKAEYPWREGNALYLVGSEGCAVLWAAKIGWNHQWRTLPYTINSFEESNSWKTPGICDQTRQHPTKTGTIPKAAIRNIDIISRRRERDGQSKITPHTCNEKTDILNSTHKGKLSPKTENTLGYLQILEEKKSLHVDRINLRETELNYLKRECEIKEREAQKLEREMLEIERIIREN